MDSGHARKMLVNLRLWVPCVMLAFFGEQVWPAPFAYITNEQNDSVSVIDTATNTVVGSPVQVGHLPQAVAVNPAGTRVYVANSEVNNNMNHTVSVIDTETNKVVSTITVGQNPRGVVVSPDGARAYVTNSNSNTVSVIDTATNTVVGAPIAVGFGPIGIAINPAGTRVYVANVNGANVSVIDTATNAVVGTAVRVGQCPYGIVVNPAGTRVYVLNSCSDTLSVIDAATNTVPLPAGQIDLNAGRPEAVAINPAGTRVYVSVPSADQVFVVDTATNAVLDPPIPVGLGPQGLAFNPDGTRLYVANSGSATVSVIDPASDSVVGPPITVGVEPVAFGQFIGPATTPPANVNYQGLWWASPAGSESGWGINFAHQGDIIFATWFTYNLSGKGLWLVMTAPKTGVATYGGTVYTTSGPPFSAVPFTPTEVVPAEVGDATLSFTGANNGTFSYTIYGVTQTKAITREVFGPLPTCATATTSLAAATNYQDLWWAAPAGVQSGWGVNLTHQGDIIFATWFTYDVDRAPMWLVVTAPKTSTRVYSGTLYRTTGPPFNAVPFDPSVIVPTAVGSATFTFSDGNSASFEYTVNEVNQTKAITREIFREPGTVCQ